MILSTFEEGVEMLNAKFESSKFTSREAIVTNFFELILDVELRTNLSTGWTSTSTRSTGVSRGFSTESSSRTLSRTLLLTFDDDVF